MNNKQLLLRNARFNELRDIALLMKDAYLEYEKLLPMEAWESYVADIMDLYGRWEKAQLIVAELNGHLVGAVTLYLNSGQEGWPDGWAGVRLLAVHPSYRGRGIGRALMEECIRRCRNHGIITIGLHTTEFMDVARRMYEKMGFVRVTEFDFHPRPGVVVIGYRLDTKPQI